jgi:hypothetical protein
MPCVKGLEAIYDPCLHELCLSPADGSDRGLLMSNKESALTKKFVAFKVKLATQIDHALIVGVKTKTSTPTMFDSRLAANISCGLLTLRKGPIAVRAMMHVKVSPYQ